MKKLLEEVMKVNEEESRLLTIGDAVTIKLPEMDANVLADETTNKKGEMVVDVDIEDAMGNAVSLYVYSSDARLKGGSK